MSILKDFINLFFPRTCSICGRLLLGDEVEICLHCLSDLPEALSANAEENMVTRRLMGRIPVEAASALLIFKQGNSAQKVLHQIKYYGNERLANQMGIMMGEKLATSGLFDNVDIIIPVPLHPKKIRIRGYNPSLLLCRGIVKSFPKPICDNNLIRTRHTETQTRKSREERLDNMQGVFALRNPKELANKHILLVDDVITTGATTEACWSALKNIEGIKISLASLAVSGDT